MMDWCQITFIPLCLLSQLGEIDMIFVPHLASMLLVKSVSEDSGKPRIAEHGGWTTIQS